MERMIFVNNVMISISNSLLANIMRYNNAVGFDNDDDADADDDNLAQVGGRPRQFQTNASNGPFTPASQAASQVSGKNLKTHYLCLKNITKRQLRK